MMDGRVDWVSWVLWGLIPQLDNLLPNPTWYRVAVGSIPTCLNADGHRVYRTPQ